MEIMTILNQFVQVILHIVNNEKNIYINLTFKEFCNSISFTKNLWSSDETEIVRPGDIINFKCDEKKRTLVISLLIGFLCCMTELVRDSY